jgi:hypothetical protein
MGFDTGYAHVASGPGGALPLLFRTHASRNDHLFPAHIFGFDQLTELLWR